MENDYLFACAPFMLGTVPPPRDIPESCGSARVVANTEVNAYSTPGKDGRDRQRQESVSFPMGRIFRAKLLKGKSRADFTGVLPELECRPRFFQLAMPPLIAPDLCSAKTLTLQSLPKSGLTGTGSFLPRKSHALKRSSFLEAHVAHAW